MTPITTFAGSKVAVFGLGGSGLVSCSALLAGGADVIAFDDNADSVAKARAAGIPTADLHDADWSRIAALVLAPGVPLTHPEPHWTVKLAQAAKVEIIGDIELFCRERRKTAPDAPLICITGTNGKSTTTALTAHLLRSAGRDVQMGGNIGVAILSLAPPVSGRCYVIECSSYQIDLAPGIDASIGILTNITPDHLDRHGTMEHYAAVKERLVQQSELSLVGVDDPVSEAIFKRLDEAEHNAVPVSATRALPWGYYVRGTQVVGKGGGETEAQAEVLGDLAGISTLRGQHNAQNAAFACAAVLHCGVAAKDIAAGLKTFPGLPHRLEEIGRKGRVLFINDSKATNADSADKALSSFPGDIFWILGGKAKEGGINPLTHFFPKIAKAYLIGEATEEFARVLEGRVPYERCGTLDVATAKAAADAGASTATEPVVLLSPACASFDQYRNFEIRGDHFRKLVQTLLA
jgi:UDP-N-acetylmuramoylalanine--D-glutamate ligase